MYLPGVEVFQAIVQGRSLTKAAEILHLSQSTVSYRLKMLERQLGAELVERGKGVPFSSLTPFGENFAGIAERWRQLREDTELLRVDGPQPELKIGAADSLNFAVLPPLYRELTAQAPQLRLQVRSQHTLESYEAVERREVDVAFVKQERSLSPLQVEAFLEDEMVLIRRAGAPVETPVSPGELDRRHGLYMSWGPDYDLWHERWWGPASGARIRVDSAGLLFSLLQEEPQWALAPRSIADVFLRSGTFAEQPMTEPAPPRVCYVVAHPAARPAARQGMALLKRVMRRLFPFYQPEG